MNLIQIRPTFVCPNFCQSKLLSNVIRSLHKMCVCVSPTGKVIWRQDHSMHRSRGGGGGGGAGVQNPPPPKNRFPLLLTLDRIKLPSQHSMYGIIGMPEHERWPAYNCIWILSSLNLNPFPLPPPKKKQQQKTKKNSQSWAPYAIYGSLHAQHKVSSDILVKPGIKSVTPLLQSEWFIPYTTTAPR